jgi:aliphatic nitrilase
VRFAVFPETFLPYYPYFSYIEPPVSQGKAHLKLYEEAIVVPGPVTQALASAARRHAMVLVVGVNERDGGTLYNAQIVFDADGAIVLKRRKITPTYHERMIWGQGDGAGLKVVDTAVGRVGALACWEHFNPLARYTLMAQGEEIHAAQFPGSLVGQVFADQMEVTIRNHALEAGCFVVNATGWLSDEQIASLALDEAMRKGLRGGNCTAIVTPEGRHVVPPMTTGEGLLIGDCDMALITKRKRMMDSVGHYARPELLQLHQDIRPARPLVQHGGTEPGASLPRNVSHLPAASAASTTRHDDHDRALDGTPDQRTAVLRSAAG